MAGCDLTTLKYLSCSCMDSLKDKSNSPCSTHCIHAQYTVYDAQYTVYIIHTAYLCSTQCMMHNKQFTMYIQHTCTYTVYTAQYTVYIVHTAYMYSTQCILHSIQFT